VIERVRKKFTIRKNITQCTRYTTTTTTTTTTTATAATTTTTTVSLMSD